MRREGWEFFPDHAGKGSHLSSYAAETGLLWMWAGLSFFLSTGDGYVGELVELQQGCERPFGRSRGKVRLASRRLRVKGLISPGGENLLDFLELRQVL